RQVGRRELDRRRAADVVLAVVAERDGEADGDKRGSCCSDGRKASPTAHRFAAPGTSAWSQTPRSRRLRPLARGGVGVTDPFALRRTVAAWLPTDTSSPPAHGAAPSTSLPSPSLPRSC